MIADKGCTKHRIIRIFKTGLDEKNDIAILSKEFSTPPKLHIPVFRYPIGKARELEWGSFIYLIGYPKGYKIITKGIVSDPDRDRQGSFLIDALFNSGLSGGILLAIISKLRRPLA